jgi:hypothetical protein
VNGARFGTQGGSPPHQTRWGLVLGIALLAAIASAVASSSPDGLERVAADLGFERHAVTLYEAPVPDYAVGGVPAWLGGPLAGLLGTAFVGGVAYGAGRLLRRPAGTAGPR